MADTPHLLIVEAPYYTEISKALGAGAEDLLRAEGVSFERISVPGALEIPAAIKFAAQSGKFDGYVALGCVIRGETTHYDYVCAESTHGLQVLAMTQGLCIGNGILTTENRDQAWVRADKAQKNKGRDAAEAALSLVRLKQQYAS
ncbi:MAG: 6,7-dimethyl-8-ribityllumazine synthase [Geminicoccus sp.]|nr:6,7-dimethyl-8-ribityllumazine synthase [Geminicoccus sp.]HCI00753.1 6,7-dimethyl-8-ribityllumazine synthase [Alphaproteobacteria bacterium]|tara:strand:- start:17 stop:451 length:435 start_codon:yes stop_codon:yes gene_type:complete